MTVKAPWIARLAALSTLTISAASLVAAPPAAPPTGKGTVRLDLQQYKVLSKAGGKEELASVEQVKPGEVIEYQLKCVNGTGQSITNLRPLLPLPVGLAFIPSSTNPDTVMASLDGKSWGAIPLKRKVKLPSGEEKTVAVPYSQYRFLRWTVSELGAGKSVKLSARARIIASAREGA